MCIRDRFNLFCLTCNLDLKIYTTVFNSFYSFRPDDGINISEKYGKNKRYCCWCHLTIKNATFVENHSYGTSSNALHSVRTIFGRNRSITSSVSVNCWFSDSNDDSEAISRGQPSENIIWSKWKRKLRENFTNWCYILKSDFLLYGLLWRYITWQILFRN